MFGLQAGLVAPEVSGAYRFGTAAILLFPLASTTKKPLYFSRREHTFLALQGMSMLALNIFFLYLAAHHLPSGLNAVVSSMASIINVAVGAIICRRMALRTPFIGASTGVVGVAVIFWPEIKNLELTQGAGLGLLLSLVGSTSFAVSIIVGE